MIDLKSVASEIRELISERQKSLGLVFEEDKHIYTMNGKKDYPSVSKVLKSFYREFPLEEAALKKAGGNPQEAERLKEEWAAAGTYSTNLGSRVHYILEKTLIENNGNYKEVRQPIFDCDLTQLMKSDNMIFAGKRYLELMESRNVELLDTEMVLGDPELGYVGQPDKVWLTMNKSGDEKYPNTALGHYYLQLPLYGKLLLKMLEGTKYENIKLYGCIISHLQEDTFFEEYRVPKEVIDTVLEMDVKKYIKK
jgi:hypothetical protein